MSDHANDRFRVAPDHPALPGHFPGNPLVPGVVVLDRVAAALRARGAMSLAGFSQVKFTATLKPGEDARIELNPIELNPIELDPRGARWRFRVLRGDVVIASGEAQTP